MMGIERRTTGAPEVRYPLVGPFVALAAVCVVFGLTALIAPFVLTIVTTIALVLGVHPYVFVAVTTAALLAVFILLGLGLKRLGGEFDW